jgi:8-amino-7-oxononanoate synthase/dethiobiotin synthase
MSSSLDRELALELAEIARRGGERRIVPASGRVDFVSNDYLGLARHPEVIAAGRAAIEEHGAGARAARLLGGGSDLDRELERAVTNWLGAEDALLFPSGYQANLGVVCALVRRGDVVLCDELVHASLVDAARLSRARVSIYRHDDRADLARKLRAGARRKLVLTEGVFSMDGDRASLAEIVALCRDEGAELVVDEAHAVGLLGSRSRPGAGAWAEAEEAGADPAALAARIVTGGKALGVAGALVVGSAALRAACVHRARSFVFTTAVAPPIVGALLAAVRVAREAGELRERALGNARRLARELDLAEPAAAIVPFVVGSNERALELAERLARAGLDARAVRPPSVPEGSARLRIVCHATNTEDEVGRLIELLRGQAGVLRETSQHEPRARVVVVVGTDTNVGKTVVSAALARALSRGGGASYWKPVQTGPDSDTQEVSRLSEGTGVHCFEPAHHFPLAASPHEAARAADATISPAELARGLEQARETTRGTLVVELAGGLLVPLTDGFTQADWLADLDAEIVLVARSGLGTLNHTLLTVEALASRGLRPRALFLVGPPHPSNRETLERASGIDALYELPTLASLEPRALDGWLEAHDLAALLES